MSSKFEPGVEPVVLGDGSFPVEAVDEASSTEAGANRPFRRALGRACLSATMLLLGSIGGAVTHKVLETTKDCPAPAEVPDIYSADLHEVRQHVADMDFGIDRPTYELFDAQLAEAESFDAVEEILNEAMESFDMKVRLGQLPQLDVGLISFNDPSNGHSPEVMQLGPTKENASIFLKSLSQIPASFLHELAGTGIYITNGITLKDGLFMASESYSGFADTQMKWNKVNQTIALENTKSIGSVFKHEVLHALFAKLCGFSFTSTDNDQRIVTAFNPEGFRYSTDEATQQRALEEGITVTAYAAKNANEDIADTGQALLEGWYRQRNMELHPIVGQKAEAIMAWQRGLEPNIRDYYLYLSFLNNDRHFPKEIAQAALADGENAFVECYGLDRWNQSRLAESSMDGDTPDYIRFDANYGLLNKTGWLARKYYFGYLRPADPATFDQQRRTNLSVDVMKQVVEDLAGDTGDMPRKAESYSYGLPRIGNLTAECATIIFIDDELVMNG